MFMSPRRAPAGGLGDMPSPRPRYLTADTPAPIVDERGIAPPGYPQACPPSQSTERPTLARLTTAKNCEPNPPHRCETIGTRHLVVACADRCRSRQGRQASGRRPRRRDLTPPYRRTTNHDAHRPRPTSMPETKSPSAIRRNDSTYRNEANWTRGPPRLTMPAHPRAGANDDGYLRRPRPRHDHRVLRRTRGATHDT